MYIEMFLMIKLFQDIQLIQTVQYSICIVFVHTQLNVGTVLFQTIQFSLSTVSLSKTQVRLAWTVTNII